MLSTWRKMSAQERRDAKTGYLALSPWMVGFVVFYAFPIIATVFFSFTQWTLAEPPIWIGLDNYARMFTRDPLFVSSLKATTSFVAISLPTKLVLGLMLALLLNLKIPGMNAFRTIFFIPAVISGVAVSLMWIWFLNPDTGVVNTLLSYFGIRGPLWFWDLHWALPSVAIMSIWKVGGAAIIYLAGLQNIPAHLYEAAEIDGASKWKRFWRITLPLLTPTLFFQLVIELIDAFQDLHRSLRHHRGRPPESNLFLSLLFLRRSLPQC